MDVQPAGSEDPYEFDAPKCVLDFKSLEANDDADQWFDCSKDMTLQHLVTPKAEKPVEKASLKCKEKNEDPNKDVAVEDNPPSNIVLSWGNGKPAAPAPAKATAQPRRVSKRTVVEVKAATPPVKKLRRNSSSAQRQRRVVRSSRRLSQKSAASTVKVQASEASTSTNQTRSTEQQELERIEALQNEVAERRRRNEASYKAALAGSQPPKKQVLSTTVPKEFNFRSDARLKRSNTVSSSTYTEVDFSSQLRKHPASPAKAPAKGTTIPKPFALSCSRKRKHEDAAAYVPMAQMIEEFQKRTPVRYHMRSRQNQERGPSPVKTERPKVTHPVTPQLMTRQRTRPQVVKSTAEIEAEEVEKMQQFKFKALELNRKILEAALVPKKPAVKEVTQPEGFQLEIEKRLQERQATKKPKEAEENYTFHSKPLPAKILEEVVGVPEKQVAPCTVPESPAFALKNRVRMERKVEEVKPAPIKALPVPHSVPFHPKLPARSVVEMCPFSFEEREREKRELKKKMEEQHKEEVHEFKATPLPDFSEVSLPEKKVLGATKPEPFRLQIDERGAAKSDRWERLMKEELKRQAEAASFKARPNTVVHKEPFVPKKENRSILATEGFQLSTERRAKERQEFEREKSEREALRALQEQQRLCEQEEQEREKLARLRQELVHKAQPIRHYKQVEVKASELPLTVPQSPNFSTRFHL